MRDSSPRGGHHGPEDRGGSLADADDDPDEWVPPVLETVAKTGDGLADFLDTLEDHTAWLTETGEGEARERKRYAAEIRRLVREDLGSLVQGELERTGGLDAKLDRVLARKTDPYTVADDVLEPFRECLQDRC